MGEEWRDIPAYEGCYQVSDKGRVRSCDRSHVTKNRWGTMTRTRRGQIKKAFCDNDGYLFVVLYKNSRPESCRVHRLVLSAFDRLPASGEEGCHKDHNPSNNNLENLCWGTRSQNENDKTASGRRPKITRSKIDARIAEAIRTAYATGLYTQQEVGRTYNVHHSNVSLIVRNKTWVP